MTCQMPKFSLSDSSDDATTTPDPSAISRSNSPNKKPISTLTMDNKTYDLYLKFTLDSYPKYEDLSKSLPNITFTLVDSRPGFPSGANEKQQNFDLSLNEPLTIAVCTVYLITSHLYFTHFMFIGFQVHSFYAWMSFSHRTTVETLTILQSFTHNCSEPQLADMSYDWLCIHFWTWEEEGCADSATDDPRIHNNMYTSVRCLLSRSLIAVSQDSFANVIVIVVVVIIIETMAIAFSAVIHQQEAGSSFELNFTDRMLTNR